MRGTVRDNVDQFWSICLRLELPPSIGHAAGGGGSEHRQIDQTWSKDNRT